MTIQYLITLPYQKTVNGKRAVFTNGEPTWYHLKQGAKACRTPLSSAGKVLTCYLKQGAEAR